MSKYEIKEMVDNFIFGTYNFLSRIKFQFSFDKKLAKKNTVYKNIHLNERCYILGTGPSLKTVDFNYLKDEVLFGVNHLYKSDLVDKINLKYYCLYDELFHGKQIDETKRIMGKLPDTTFFVRTKAYGSFKKNGVSCENICYQPCNLFQYGDHINIDMTKCMSAPYNVVLGCIQTAMYMGFTEIYLLGCDFNSFATLKPGHFYDDASTVQVRNMSLGYEMKFYTLVTYHHYALEKYAKSYNIHIYNITDNSLLDAYDRIDSKEHFAAISGKLKG